MPAKLTAVRSCLTACILLVSMVAFSQQKTVTGRVVDNLNQPVNGASVMVKGTTTGSTTDEQGRFSLTVPGGQSTLVVSYVGFEATEIPVNTANEINNLNVSLGNPISSLNEVLVTGYTSQRKRDITGAVTVVNVADLKSQPAIDATSQLQGRASGVTVVQNGVPGAGATVRIRGLGSFQNNNPLYVIDGVQTSNLSGLNPNDIESMQVLKDAASASIYGVRGSNGVIIVTTKKGRKGAPNVSYEMYYGVQDPGKGPDLLNAQEEAELLFLARKHSGLTLAGSVYGNSGSPVLPDYIFYTGAPNDGTPIMEGNPGVDPAKYDLDFGRLGDPGYSPYIIVPTSKQGTDWYEEATRSAPIQSHNLTLSSATDNGRYLVSLNYFDQEAITHHQFYKRYTARVNSEFNLFNRIRIGENIQVFSSESNVPGRTTDPNANNGEPEANNTEASIIAQTTRISSVVPIYTINGDFAGTAGGSGFGTWGNGKNPVAQLYRNRNNRSNHINIFGNVYAEADITNQITLRSSFGGAINTRNRFEYPFIEYEHVENNANTTYNERMVRNHNWIWTNQATYKNSFGGHNVTGLVGTEAQKSAGLQIIGASTTFFTYNYQPFINLANGAVQNLGGSSIFAPVTTVSYFAKVDYDFNGKYLASALVRRDGSSKFRDGYRWGTFPAFSLGWRISEESFLNSVAWINDLKVRGSWGKMGNEAAVSAGNAFTTFESNRQSSWYDINGAQNAPLEGFFLNFNANPVGSWEENITTNIGFDATLFNSSTEVVFDWYQRKTEGLLFDPPTPAIFGSARVPYQNVGSMKNNGIDLLISNRSNISRAVKLNTTLTFTTYNNEITAISNDGLPFFDFNSTANEANRIGGNATRNFVGSSLNTYYGYQVIGLFQTEEEAIAWSQRGAGPGRLKYADINGDKRITADDRTIIGNPNPDFSYGLNVGAELYNFDISAFFYGVSGKDAFSFTRWYTDFSGGFPGGRSKRALYESWLPDGSRPNASVPIQEASVVEAGFSSSGVVSSYFVENASYFRLRNVQIGYTLPSSLLSRIRVTKARIYVQGTNLFTITDYTGLDPDITSTDDRANGIDIGAYPTVRQFLVGVSLNFQ